MQSFQVTLIPQSLLSSSAPQLQQQQETNLFFTDPLKHYLSTTDSNAKNNSVIPIMIVNIFIDWTRFSWKEW